MKSPTVWYSRRRSTVETSTFGSDFVAMRQATELIEGLRYKLRMFGIPIDGPTGVYGDSGAVISNSSIPTLTLTKTHNAICYHRVREAVAAGTTAIGKVHTDHNLADLFTKHLSLKEDTTPCSVLPTKLNGRRSHHESARSKAPTLAVASGICLVRMGVPG